MSGYFAGLMRQTGIGPAAPSTAAPDFAAPVAMGPPEEHVTVDAAPPPAAPAAPEAGPAHAPPSPASPAFPPIPQPPVAGPPIHATQDSPAHASAPPVPPEVTVSRAAPPPPPLVVPPAGVPERRIESRTEGDDDASPPPTPSIPVRIIEQTVEREGEPAPPVRTIPSLPPPPRAPEAPGTTLRIFPAAAPVEAAAEVPAAPPARVHPFAEVLAEARRWVAATPAPGEPRRPDETAMAEADGLAPAPAGPRPRRQHANLVEASEEMHLSIGAITVTIEDPAAARPAPRAAPPRPEPDHRSRLSRVYLRPE